MASKIVFFQFESESDESAVEVLVRVLAGDEPSQVLTDLTSETRIGFQPNDEEEEDEDDEDSSTP